MSDPLVLVPGHMCGAWLYAHQMAAFPDAIIADVNRDDTVAAIAGRLLESAPARFHIAGLSMGGMVAMEVMAEAPDRVASACLTATDPTEARPKEITWRSDLIYEGIEAYVATFVRQFVRHDPEGLAGLAEEVQGHMAGTPEAVIRAQAHALDTRREMAPRIAGYNGPVEVIAGARDRVCPPHLHEDLAAQIPNARLTVVPDCGHMVTLEKPDDVLRALLRLVRA
ncbi:MAG: alpha/beta fold hydrolase [Pseudomonadota bacterium]